MFCRFGHMMRSAHLPGGVTPEELRKATLRSDRKTTRVADKGMLKQKTSLPKSVVRKPTKRWAEIEPKTTRVAVTRSEKEAKRIGRNTRTIRSVYDSYICLWQMVKDVR